MEKRVIIINGVDGAGKNMFIDLVNRVVPAIRTCPGDDAERAAKILGWDGTYDDKSKDFLKTLEFMASSYYDHTFDYLVSFVRSFNNILNSSLLFLILRDPVEIERAKKEFNAVTVLIRNDRVPFTHIDAAIYDYSYDFVIDNDGGIEDLEWDVCRFLLLLVAQENFNGDVLAKAEELIIRGLA